MTSLKSWRRVLEEFPHHNVPRRLSDANARFRLASSQSEIKISGYAIGTQSGYSVLFQVALCFSALEAVESAFDIDGKGSPRTQICDAELSNMFRSAKMMGFLDALGETIDRDGSRVAFEEFRTSKSENLRILASVIRNSIFHARISPSKLKLSSKYRHDLLQKLAELTLNAADSRFTELVNRAIEPGNDVRIRSKS